MTKATHTDQKKFFSPRVKPLEEIDEEKLENRLLNYLSERASYVSELGREFSEEFGKDPSRLKIDCHKILREHVSSGAIRRRKLEDEYENVRIYYFHKQASESLFHMVMISLAKGLIAREGFELLKPRAGCDCAFKIGQRKIGLECETGLKDYLKEFVEDLRKRSKVYNEIWVICRNSADRKRYRERIKQKVSSPNVKFKTLKLCKETLRRIKK